ncbi:MFS transporter [Nocardiopsis sp. JB363]|uniref:MFS transporter n=1 Tax=Nocardiopsis sp. JB363 TaxID=1434837 RepID=UPI0021010962|nr:MFS transporter [Nocardiopsis sp. JB363]
MAETECPTPPGERSLLRRFTAYSLGTSLADFVYGAVFVTIFLGRGAEPWMVGSIMAGANLVGLLMEAPSGALGDRYGHRRLLFVGLLSWGAGFLFVGAAPTLPLTLVGMCFGTVGFALHSGTMSAILINRVGSRDRTTRIARIVRVGALSGRIGSALGAALVMVAGTWLSPGPLVACGGLLLLSLAALTPLSFPHVQGRPDRRIGVLVLESVSQVLSRRFAPMVALAMGAMSATVLLVASWQPMLLERFGQDVRLNGLFLLVMTLSLAAGAAAARWVHPRRPHVWGPLSVMAIGVPVVLAAHDVIPLIVGLVAAEFLIGLAGVVAGVWYQLMFTDANRNTMFSTISTLAMLAGVATSFSFGWLWDLWGIPVAVTVMASGAVIGGAISLVLTHLFPESTEFAEPERDDSARNSEPESS